MARGRVVSKRRAGRRRAGREAGGRCPGREAREQASDSVPVRSVLRQRRAARSSLALVCAVNSRGLCPCELGHPHSSGSPAVPREGSVSQGLFFSLQVCPDSLGKRTHLGATQRWSPLSFPSLFTFPSPEGLWAWVHLSQELPVWASSRQAGVTFTV